MKCLTCPRSTSPISNLRSQYLCISGARALSEVPWNAEQRHAGFFPSMSFATLPWDDCRNMLPTVASLAEELAKSEPDRTPLPSGIIDFHSLDLDILQDGVARRQLAEDPNRAGTARRFFHSPGVYIICTGTADETMKTRLSAAGRSNRIRVDTIRTPGYRRSKLAEEPSTARGNTP